MIERTQEALSNEEEKQDLEELQKELAFYKSQTKVLREKNRDLRNAMLLSDVQQGTEEPVQETAHESLSDIRKIIADSKKTISEKLTQFKETIDETHKNGSISAEKTSSDNSNSAPSPPKFTAVMDIQQSDTIKKETSIPTASTPIAAETEALQNQIEYLKREIDRIETFLEQSEMVNDRLRQLLTEHSIDVSEITKAINEVSKTAISSKAVKIEESIAEPESKVEKPIKTEPIEPKVEPKVEPVKKELDPAVAKIFDDFKTKLDSGIGEDDIKMEILELRETLMDYIPHSRVFYEMQVEYRKWKRGTSSIDDLKKAMENWKETIVTTN
ncbi:MAG: hypothetical protein EAX90_10640 [Candidatus Heimdallarchaeota archaeon]|nr:hypothetical protein [Candidatus Heimdallarchaeota archaeon]